MLCHLAVNVRCAEQIDKGQQCRKRIRMSWVQLHEAIGYVKKCLWLCSVVLSSGLASHSIGLFRGIS